MEVAWATLEVVDLKRLGCAPKAGVTLSLPLGPPFALHFALNPVADLSEQLPQIPMSLAFN